MLAQKLHHDIGASLEVDAAVQVRLIGPRRVSQANPCGAHAVELVDDAIDRLVGVQVARTSSRDRVDKDHADIILANVPLGRSGHVAQRLAAGVDRRQRSIAGQSERSVDVAQPVGHRLGATLEIDEQHPPLAHRLPQALKARVDAHSHELQRVGLPAARRREDDRPAFAQHEWIQHELWRVRLERAVHLHRHHLAYLGIPESSAELVKVVLQVRLGIDDAQPVQVRVGAIGQPYAVLVFLDVEVRPGQHGAVANHRHAAVHAGSLLANALRTEGNGVLSINLATLRECGTLDTVARAHPLPRLALALGGLPGAPRNGSRVRATPGSTFAESRAREPRAFPPVRGRTARGRSAAD